MSTAARSSIAALRASHERLAVVVRAFSTDDLARPSYAREWDIAQVLGHLGSTAEVFTLRLDAALAGTDPPGRDRFPPIWERWDARSPRQVAADCLSIDAQVVRRLEALDDGQLDAIGFEVQGMRFDAIGLVRGRLAEHALHTWDVTVVEDPAAVLWPDAAEQVIDTLVAMAPLMAKPPDEAARIGVTTTDPTRAFALVANGRVNLEPSAASDEPARVELPAEAFIRLVYGRLDAEHTPMSTVATGVDLDVVRRMFPGV